MISGNQEVSGFGPDNDTGDNWIVECESKEKYWVRGAPVSFRHVDTAKYLSTGEVHKFNTQNCGHQCPIMVSIHHQRWKIYDYMFIMFIIAPLMWCWSQGQTEVSAARKDAKALWVTGQGVYFTPKSGKGATDEL